MRDTQYSSGIGGRAHRYEPRAEHRADGSCRAEHRADGSRRDGVGARARRRGTYTALVSVTEQDPYGAVVTYVPSPA